MKKLLAVVAAVVALAAIGVTAAISSGDGRAVLKFDTMAPVVPPYTGVTNPIRGVNGGGVAWELESAQGRLRADGRLDIEVAGACRRLHWRESLSDVQGSRELPLLQRSRRADDGERLDGSGAGDDDGKRRDRREGRAAVAVLRPDCLRDVGQRQLVRGHRPLRRLRPAKRVGSPGRVRPDGPARP